MAMEAITRGTTRYWMGETAIVSIASICSVTRIVPELGRDGAARPARSP